MSQIFSGSRGLSMKLAREMNMELTISSPTSSGSRHL
jgi:hypothetical protein